MEEVAVKAGSTVKRKLGKLLRNPTSFLRDSRLVQAVVTRTSKRASLDAPALPVKAPAAKPAPSTAKFLRDSRLVQAILTRTSKRASLDAPALPAKAPVAPRAPSKPNVPRVVAVAVGVPAPLRAHVERSFPAYNFAFCESLVDLDLARRKEPRALIVLWHKSTDGALALYLTRHPDCSIALLSEGLLSVAGPVRGDAPPYSFVLTPLNAKGQFSASERLPDPLTVLCDQALAPATSRELSQARACIEGMRRLRVGQYNFVSASHWESQLPARPPEGKRVLVLGDREGSGADGSASESTNLRLVQAVLQDYPNAAVVFRPHPADAYATPARVHPGVRSLISVLDKPTALRDVLEQVDEVCLWDSTEGFEALLVDTKVTTYGRPFFAGRGLTHDRDDSLKARPARSLEDIVLATFVRGAVYLHPATRKRLDAESALAAAVCDRSMTCARELLGLPVRPHKRKAISFRVGEKWRPALVAMLPEFDVEFIEKKDEKRIRDRLDRAKAAHPDVAVVLWGYFQPKNFDELAAELALPVFRFEDGFLRSVGIGAERDAWGGLNLPVSLTVDSRGIYYNRQELSDIELLLLTYPFERDPLLLERARVCIARINEFGLTKYNLTVRASVSELLGPKTRKRVLVIGQVESDASIRFGCSNVVNNNDLVQLAVQENPDAEVIYKPHPVVMRGAAGQLSDPRAVASICRILHQEVNLPDLLSEVDHVYVITSGVGFEAMLKGLKVTCLGSNFYAGWGLTDDRDPVPRRTRQLTVEEIFAGFYLLHTRYYDHGKRKPIQLEEAIDLLLREREQQLGVEFAVRGTKALEGGDVTTAREQLEIAVRYNAGMLRWWQSLATARELSGDLVAAKDCYDHALAQFPMDATWYLQRAKLGVRLNNALVDVEHDFELAVRHASNDAGVAKLHRFAHVYTHGGPWLTLLDEAAMAAELSYKLAPDAALMVATALIEADRLGYALRLYGLVQSEGGNTARAPLRLRAAFQSRQSIDQPDEWTSELMDSLLAGLGLPISLPELGTDVVPILDDTSIGKVSEKAFARAVYVGETRHGGISLVHAPSAPVRVSAPSIVLSEHLLDLPEVGWYRLFETIGSDTRIRLIPREVYRSLTRRVGFRPSTALTLVTWLSECPRGLAPYDVSGLWLATPVADSDGPRERAEKKVFAELAGERVVGKTWARPSSAPLKVKSTGE